MREPLGDIELGAALRGGLRALPVPDVSPDFDARVLNALRAPIPWWQRLWEPARPLLLGASCSLSVTLVLLHWTLTAPAPRPPFQGGSERSQASAPAHAPSLDRLLDRPDLRAGSLAAAWGGPLAPTAVDGGGAGETPPDRRPEPTRHAQARRRAALIV